MRGSRARILTWHTGATNHNSKISRFITHLANKSSILNQPRPKYFATYRLLSKSKQRMQQKHIILFDVFLFEGKSNVSRQLFLVTPLTWVMKDCSCTSDKRWPSVNPKGSILVEWVICQWIYPVAFVPISVAGYLSCWQFICSLVTFRLVSSAAAKAMTALSCRILLNESCQDRFIYKLLLYPLACCTARLSVRQV